MIGNKVVYIVTNTKTGKSHEEMLPINVNPTRPGYAFCARKKKTDRVKSKWDQVFHEMEVTK